VSRLRTRVREEGTEREGCTCSPIYSRGGGGRLLKEDEGFLRCFLDLRVSASFLDDGLVVGEEEEFAGHARRGEGWTGRGWKVRMEGKSLDELRGRGSCRWMKMMMMIVEGRSPFGLLLALSVWLSDLHVQSQPPLSPKAISHPIRPNLTQHSSQHVHPSIHRRRGELPSPRGSSRQTPADLAFPSLLTGPRCSHQIDS
jgi:hypothetical protein